MTDATRIMPLTDFDSDGRISSSEFFFWQGQLQSLDLKYKSYEPGGSRAGKYSPLNDVNQDGIVNRDDFSARFGGSYEQVLSSVQHRIASGDLSLVTAAPGGEAASALQNIFAPVPTAVSVVGASLLLVSVGIAAFFLIRRLAGGR